MLDAVTSADDFLLTDVRKKKMTIYIGIQPNKLAESRLIVNLFFIVPNILLTLSLVPLVGKEWALFLCYVQRQGRSRRLSAACGAPVLRRQAQAAARQGLRARLCGKTVTHRAVCPFWQPHLAKLHRC